MEWEPLGYFKEYSLTDKPLCFAYKDATHFKMDVDDT